VQAIVAIVMRPLSPDEGPKIGNDNKEKEIRELFAALMPAEALLLRRRFAADRSNDELVAAFKRLTIERRTRLVAYLADARRGRL
jgi:hypothetical protein